MQPTIKLLHGVSGEKISLQCALLFILGYVTLSLSIFFHRTELELTVRGETRANNITLLAERHHHHNLFRTIRGNRTDALSLADYDSGPDHDDALTGNSSLTKILIIVPYRNRAEQLASFVPAITQFLSRHCATVGFGIIVVEQTGKAKFNKGALINIGFIEGTYKWESTNDDPNSYFDCVVIHDIDLIPENDGNTCKYDCLRVPGASAWQLSTAIDKYKWGLPMAGVGGVGMATREAFLLANGWSNRFFGWGGEDNDFFARLSLVGRRMRPVNKTMGRYRSLKKGHNRSGELKNRSILLSSYERRHHLHEGFPTVKYRLQQRKMKESYFFVRLDLWMTEDPDQLPEKIGPLIWDQLAYWD